MQDLHEEVTKAEVAERVRRGLPPAHVLDISHFPFAFALPAVETFNAIIDRLAAHHPNQAHIVMSQAMGALAQRDYQRANGRMDRYRLLAPEEPIARMRFGHVPTGPFVALPPVEGDWPRQPGFFFSCDRGYFDKYAVPLLRSIAATNPGFPVHVHLMSPHDARATLGQLPLTLTSSWEDPAQRIAELGISPQNYYCAVRLIRFAEALENNPGPLWMADVDGLVTGSLAHLLTIKAEMAMRIRPGRIEPWHQFSACLLMGTPSSRPYYRRVAEILREDLPWAWWGMDQYALFSAGVGVRSIISLIGPDVASGTDEPGLFWFTGGARKADLGKTASAYAALYRLFAG